MKKLILLALLTLLLYPTIASAITMPGCSFTNMFGLENILVNICNFIYGIALFVIVVFIVLAGIYFVIARGDPEKIKTARDFLLYAIIGAVIIFGAWIVVTLAQNLVG